MTLDANPGRAGRRPRRAGHGEPRLPTVSYRRLTNPYAPIEQLSADQVEAIHAASLTVLAEIGMRVLLPEARAIYRAAGCTVDEASQVVRFDPGLVMAALATAPERVELTCRNPERSSVLGGREVIFATVGGAPNVSDVERGKRPGSLADFENFMRLGQSFDVIQAISAAPEPVDVPPGLRHLDMMRAVLTLTDKFPFVYARGAEPVADALEMVRLAHGVERQAFADRVRCYTVVNTNSPLQLDIPMGRGIIDMARAGQLTIVTPFTLSGAMAPVSLAGALVQQNAEALAGIALAQMVSPGAAVAYGGFTSNVDMKSGAPAFGTPEYVKAAFASGQLARRYRLPWRSSSTNASNVADAQAAYESQMSLWGALLGGANFILHGAGWLEGGLTASYEKFLIDIEMLQGFAELFRPLDVSDADLALDAMREVGHGGHFFGCAHTLARYETAFYAPLVSDWRNFGNWSEAGSPDALARAATLWRKTLAAYQPPPIAAEAAAGLDDYVARRKAEGGAKLDD